MVRVNSSGLLRKSPFSALQSNVSAAPLFNREVRDVALVQARDFDGNFIELQKWQLWESH
jgi:hypothetical protein